MIVNIYKFLVFVLSNICRSEVDVKHTTYYIVLNELSYHDG